MPQSEPEPAVVVVVEPQDPPDADNASAVDLVEDDLLVEDVSIDGMCGVY
jgi:mycofactocin precursor